MEMFVSENGPILVCANPLFKRAIWRNSSKIRTLEEMAHGTCMYHSDETRFYPQDESRTMKRLQKEKSKLSFVDA